MLGKTGESAGRVGFKVRRTESYTYPIVCVPMLPTISKVLTVNAKGPCAVQLKSVAVTVWPVELGENVQPGAMRAILLGRMSSLAVKDKMVLGATRVLAAREGTNVGATESYKYHCMSSRIANHIQGVDRQREGSLCSTTQQGDGECLSG